MTPVAFAGCNKILKPPEGVPNLEPLAVKTDGKITVSCWKVDIFERVKILFAGEIWMEAMGQTQPPISLTADQPDLKPPKRSPK